MTVYPIVVDRLHDYYRQFVKPENIVYDKSLAAAHSMVTESYGHPCAYQGDGNRPEDIFINDCDYDAAGKLLGHILGPLKPPATKLIGSIVAFDQDEFIADPVGHSMNPAGYAYIPADVRRRRDLPRARRVPRLPPATGTHRRPVLRERRLQPLGGYEPDHRVVSADDQQRPAAGVQPARLLGLVGLRRSEFCKAERAADARGDV